MIKTSLCDINGLTLLVWMSNNSIHTIYGEKSNHAYVSDDKKHDQTFAKLVLEEMLETVENIPETCIIESDNCSAQYKSVQHFDDIEGICNKIGVPIIRLFSVAGHGKGEVDHVGGLAKCSICRYVGTGGKVLNATDCQDCQDFLETKFAEKTNPKFFIKLIDVNDLADSRAVARLKKYRTIDGSDSFQVMVFQPNSTTFKAASHLCTCDDCLIDYGSSLFSLHELRTQTLKKIFLRSVESQNSDDRIADASDDFLLADTYCAVAPAESSPESLCFIRVKDSFESTVEMSDDYANVNAPGFPYIEGRFMEKVKDLSKGYLYKLSKKKTFFFKKSVVGFVQFTGHKNGLFLSTEEYVEILNYVESNGLSRI